MTSRQHLHPLTFGYFVYKEIANFFLLLLIGIPWLNDKLADRGYSINSLIILAVFLGLLVLYSWLKYWFFTYELTATAIIINKGVFIKNHSHIPYGKIQSLNKSQPFFLKFWHLIQLQIETASHDDDGPEAFFPVVNNHLYETINHRLNHQENAETEQPVVSHGVRYQINPHELNLFALTSLGIIPIILTISVVFDRLNEIIPERLFNKLTSAMTNSLVGASIVIIIAAIFVILLIGMLVSYLTLIQKYYHFTLNSSNQKLITTRGLLTTKETTVAIKRIQALHIEQSIIRQLFHLVTIKAITASADSEDETTNNAAIIPVIKEEHAVKTVRQFIDWAPVTITNWHHVPAVSKWYFIRNAVLLTLIPVTIISIIKFPLGLLSALLLIVAVFMGLFVHKNTQFSCQANQLILQTGSLFTKNTYVVPRKNIQSLSLNQSIWMAKKDLAHLSVDVRSGDDNLNIELRYLNAHDVQAVYDWFYHH